MKFKIHPLRLRKLLFLLIFLSLNLYGIWHIVGLFNPTDQKFAPWMSPNLPAVAFPDGFSPAGMSPYEHVYMIYFEDVNIRLTYENCPFVMNLSQRGAICDEGMLVYEPASSQPCYMSIGTGTRPFVHNFLTNRDAADWTYFNHTRFETIFELAKKQGYNVSICANEDWNIVAGWNNPGSYDTTYYGDTLPIHGDMQYYREACFNFRESIETQNSSAKSLNILKLDVSSSAHVNGMYAQETFDEYRAADQQIQTLFQQLEAQNYLNDSLFIFFGDHGMNMLGEHGGGDYYSTHPPCIIYAPRYMNAGFKIPHMLEMDLASYTCFALGLPVPRTSLGRVNYDVFAGIPESYKAAYACAHAQRSLNIYEGAGEYTNRAEFDKFAELQPLVSNLFTLYTEGKYSDILQTEATDPDSNHVSGAPATSIERQIQSQIDMDILEISQKYLYFRLTLTVILTVGVFIAFSKWNKKIVSQTLKSTPVLEITPPIQSQIPHHKFWMVIFGLLPIVIFSGLWTIGDGFGYYWGEMMGRRDLHVLMVALMAALTGSILIMVFLTPYLIKKGISSQSYTEYAFAQRNTLRKGLNIVGLLAYVAMIIYVIYSQIFNWLKHEVRTERLGLDFGMQYIVGTFFISILVLYFSVPDMGRTLHNQFRTIFMDSLTVLSGIIAISTLVVFILLDRWNISTIYNLSYVNEGFTWMTLLGGFVLFHMLLLQLVLAMKIPSTRKEMIKWIGVILVEFLGLAALVYGILAQM